MIEESHEPQPQSYYTLEELTNVKDYSQINKIRAIANPSYESPENLSSIISLDVIDEDLPKKSKRPHYE